MNILKEKCFNIACPKIGLDLNQTDDLDVYVTHLRSIDYDCTVWHNEKGQAMAL